MVKEWGREKLFSGVYLVQLWGDKLGDYVWCIKMPKDSEAEKGWGYISLYFNLRQAQDL